MRLSGARTAPRSTARWLLASLLVGLAALSLLPHAHALFEDQAGAFDWHKALIGIPQRSMLVQPPASPRRPHLITVTAKNVLASLDPVKGALRWRHAFPKHSEHLDPVHGWDVHVAPVKAGRSYVATVTTPMPLRHDLAVTDIDLDASFDNDGARTLLRVWDLDTGFIVLEQEIASAATSTAYGPPVVRFAPSPPPGGNDAADDEGDDVDVDAQGRKRPGPLVIVALPGVEAVAYRVVTGAKLWSTPLPATPGGVAAILTDADASLKRPGGTVHLATADAHAPARVTLQTLAVAQGTPTRDAMTFSVPATASAAAPVTLKLHAHRGHVYVALMDATRALLLGETLKTPAVLSRLGDDNDDDVGAIAMSAAPSATEALMQTLDADRLVFLNDDPNTLIVALERVAADVANGAPPAATAMPAVAWTLWKLDGASFVPVPEHHGIRFGQSQHVLATRQGVFRLREDERTLRIVWSQAQTTGLGDVPSKTSITFAIPRNALPAGVPIRQLVANAAPLGPAGAPMLMLTFADGFVVTATPTDGLVWQRREFLAHVAGTDALSGASRAAVFINLPPAKLYLQRAAAQDLLSMPVPDEDGETSHDSGHGSSTHGAGAATTGCQAMLRHWWTRFKRHIVELERTLQNLPAYLSRVATQLVAPATANRETATNVTWQDNMLADTASLGLVKLVVILSETGRLTALQTDTGAVLWSHWLGRAMAPGETLQTMAFTPHTTLLAIISPATSTVQLYEPWHGEPFTITENDVPAPATAAAGSSLAGGHHHGHHPERIPATTTFGEAAVLVQPLSLTATLPLVVFVTADHRLHVFPRTRAAQNVLAAHAGQFYYYTIRDGARIDGFVIDLDPASAGRPKPPRGAAQQRVDPQFRGVHLWSHVVEGTVRAATQPERGRPVASLGKVLGDRSVHYKYLNPNVLYVSTEARGPGVSGVSAFTSAVRFYMIDVVTGALYYEALHPGGGTTARGARDMLIHATGHSVLYTYWNHGPEAAELLPDDPLYVMVNGRKRRRKRLGEEDGAAADASAPGANSDSPPPTAIPDTRSFEVVSLDLFEGAKPDERLTQATFSSYQAQRPHVQARAFTFSRPLQAVGSTRTLHGITAEEVVWAQDDSIIGTPRAMWDARRPLTLSNDDKEEMLMPYRPSADIGAQNVRSYSRHVVGIETIMATTTRLESTGLVFCFGLDMFFFRANPSKTFDLLAEDFSYGGLIATIVLLYVGIRMAEAAATRKRLELNWR